MTLTIPMTELPDAQLLARLDELIKGDKLYSRDIIFLHNLNQRVMALKYLQDETLDLRAIDEPTGGDDADVAWVVIQHHMAKPQEREIGRGRTPMEAIKAAIVNQAADIIKKASAR